MPINPSYQSQPMFNNPYGGGGAPSMPSGGSGMSLNPYYGDMFANPYAPAAPSGGGGGGGWMNSGLGGNMASGGAAGFMAGGPVGAAIGAGLPLVTGLLGALFGGDSEQEKAFKEAARIRQQRKGEMGAGQSAYQRQAASLFPEMPQDAFTYKNPTLDNAITNALMYRMGNLFSDWGMPQDRRQGGQNLQQQFLGGMNFSNPYGAPPPQAAPQPDLTVSPGRPEGSWMAEFQGQQSPRRGRRGGV